MQLCWAQILRMLTDDHDEAVVMRKMSLVEPEGAGQPRPPPNLLPLIGPNATASPPFKMHSHDICSILCIPMASCSTHSHACFQHLST